MKRVSGMTLSVVAGIGLLLAPQAVHAQVCSDEVSMIDASKQTLVELTERVKKESLLAFERSNEQKSAVNKLGIHISMLGELVNCLDKAAQDSTASKADVEADKGRRDAAAKLLEKIQHQQSGIKNAKDSKGAKDLIEKLDLTS